MFSDKYSVTVPGVDLLTSTTWTERAPQVGCYNNGLVVIPDANLAGRLLHDWKWLVGSEATVMLYTGMGDVFFRQGREIHFLETQRAGIEFIDEDPAWFLDEFMTNPSVLEDVLRKSFFDELVERRRPLDYGEVFVLEPWLSLGGEDRVESYTIGSAETYLSLLGQSFSSSSNG